MLLVVYLSSRLLLSAEDPATNVVFRYHSRVPLGNDTLELEPGGRLLALFATAESPEFDGMQRNMAERDHTLLRADGSPVRYFPRQIAFRVTASLDTRLFNAGSPYPFKPELPPDEFITKLAFRILIFHGLERQVVEPESAEMIGVPADIGSSERMYRVVFNLPLIPIEDRVVLEVVSPDGERLTKFHLDLA